MMSAKSEFAIEKLRGSENYHNWVFAMQNYIEMKKLLDCLVPQDDQHPETPKEGNADKLSSAKSIIALSVEPDLYVHIRSCGSALAMWKVFQRLYEDRGLLRKIGLLKTLMSIKLENCENMQTYIGQITATASKLSCVNFEIQDDWLSAILLAGLTEDYKPLIMSFEAVKTINSDEIKMKLLDTETNDNGTNSAFFGNKNFKSNSKKKNHKKKCNICSKWHAGICNKKPNDGEQKNAQGSGKEKSAFSAIAMKAEHADSNGWYLDSGASSHMTPNESIMINKKTANINEIIAANSSRMPVKSAGNAVLHYQGNEIKVYDIMHVPDLTVNLLSIFKMVSKGNTIIFDESGCSIYNKNDEQVAHVKPLNGVYKLQAETAKCMIAKGNSETALTWHRRMGHLNYQSLLKLRNGAADGINFIDDKEVLANCETCAMGKQARLPFGKSESRSTELLQLIHSDVCGPMENESIGRSRYMLTFIDDYSKKVFCYFIRQKSDVFERFTEFKALVENQTSKRIKILRTDNGTEYMSEKFNQFLAKNGIQHQTTCPYTAQQNGVSERYNRTITERARCLLHDAGLPKIYWAEAMNMSVYLINRSVCTTWADKTPEEVYSGKRTNLSDLRIFGSTIMVHIPKEKRKKLDYKSRKLIFVGYDTDSKGYRCIDEVTRKFSISRDVIFHENIKMIIYELDGDECNDNETQPLGGLNEEKKDVNVDPVRENVERDNVEIQNINNSIGTQHTSVISINDTSSEDETIDDNVNDPEYEPDETVTIDTENRPVTRQASGLNPLNLINFAFIAEPVSVGEAMASNDCKRWKNAMQSEMDSLMENKTWSLVDAPRDRKPLKTKWVFTTKEDMDGNIVRYKARLVAKGCSQLYGIDYNETFSPVVRYSTIRFLIAMAVKKKLNIDQMDAITAFLQGELDEEIYIYQPEGFKNNSNQVCRLNKAMYGLKQAGRQWNLKLDSALMSYGLIKSQMDPCVYYKRDGTLYLAIYVDDILIFWRDRELLMELKNKLSHSFKMKDMGKAQGCIGMKITQTANSIELDQSKYINDILIRFKMQDAKAISMPSDPNQKLPIEMITDDDINTGKIPYQEAVGSLLYVAQCTRPDIAFAVNDVSRFNSNFGLVHWNAVKRIIRYLKGTIDYKLKFTYDGMDILGYTDSDWASDLDKRRSCTGYVFKLSDGAISWMSKRQPTVALSTTEAEYMAMSAATQEAIWLRQLYAELNHGTLKPLKLFCDNQGAIKMAGIDCYRARTKHIDIRHHFIREKINDKTIDIQYLPTNEMVADGLTKAVTKEKTEFCAMKMGLCYAK